jgi:hypothetical protein
MRATRRGHGPLPPDPSNSPCSLHRMPHFRGLSEYRSVQADWHPDSPARASRAG